MKTSSIVTLLTLSISLLAAPIPDSANPPQEECSQYASCRPSLSSAIRIWRSKHSSYSSITNSNLPHPTPQILAEPHFPTHQLRPPQSENSEKADSAVLSAPSLPATKSSEQKKDDTWDSRRLLPPPALKALESSRPESTPNPNLEAALRGLHEDVAKSAEAANNAWEQFRESEAFRPGARKTDDVPVPTTVLLAGSRDDTDAKQLELKSANLKDIKETIVGGRKFGLKKLASGLPYSTTMGSRTVTYTYGYTYVRRDYSDVLVVGLVIIFLIAVLLVELLEKTTRTFMGIHPSQIRLEDWDCECGREIQPQFEKFTFKLQPAPKGRNMRTKAARSTWEQWMDEKTGETYVIEDARPQ